MRYFFSLLLLLNFSCKNETSNQVSKKTEKIEKEKRVLSQSFKKYWYNGSAEISSYSLTQSRYGELRTGEAVLVYVTEDFLPNIQVKADLRSDSTKAVLKLNSLKRFYTGVYPYSIMQSVFTPVKQKSSAFKVSSSVQEWCGHNYKQINNKQDFYITSHSYFEGEADENFKLKKGLLENDIWTKLRINPKELPEGKFKMIPSLEYLTLKHKELKYYEAIGCITDSTYSLVYPNLERFLQIKFEKDFPYHIKEWEEHYKRNDSNFITKAKVNKTLNIPYWSLNKVKDSIYRSELNLKF
jgi:hypothetical protein